MESIVYNNEGKKARAWFNWSERLGIQSIFAYIPFWGLCLAALQHVYKDVIRFNQVICSQTSTDVRLFSAWRNKTLFGLTSVARIGVYIATPLLWAHLCKCITLARQHHSNNTMSNIKRYKKKLGWKYSETLAHATGVVRPSHQMLVGLSALASSLLICSEVNDIILNRMAQRGNLIALTAVRLRSLQFKTSGCVPLYRVPKIAFFATIPLITIELSKSIHYVLN